MLLKAFEKDLVDVDDHGVKPEMPAWQFRNVCPQTRVRGLNGIGRHHEALFRKKTSPRPEGSTMVVV
jgi:hypothetical protein